MLYLHVVCVPHGYLINTEKLEEDIGHPETGVADGYEPACGC